jgi:ferritin-like metal-binding protein YciE
MTVGSLKDLYLAELGDLYDAETQAIMLTRRLADAASGRALRAVLKQHCEEAMLHRERIQLIFTHWGQPRASRACAGMAGIVQEADDRLDEPATREARDAVIIAIALRIGHYEIAAYGGARTFARWLDRLDDVRLLEETIDEKVRAERRLTAVAESNPSTSTAA